MMFLTVSTSPTALVDNLGHLAYFDDFIDFDYFSELTGDFADLDDFGNIADVGDFDTSTDF